MCVDNSNDHNISNNRTNEDQSSEQRNGTLQLDHRCRQGLLFDDKCERLYNDDADNEAVEPRNQGVNDTKRCELRSLNTKTRSVCCWWTSAKRWKYIGQHRQPTSAQSPPSTIEWITYLDSNSSPPTQSVERLFLFPRWKQYLLHTCWHIYEARSSSALSDATSPPKL